MTYCVAIKVDDGLVFASDTRTSAGVDDVRTYNKLHIFETTGERVFAIQSAGNLATTQSVINQIKRDMADPMAPVNLNNVRHMYDAAEYVGNLSVRAQQDSAALGQLRNSTVDYRTTLILGGQILGEEPALYLIYPEGNCIAASQDMPYLQVGESKYGKPILDRIIRSYISLADAARCALVSLDSTMKSNLTVGPPLDLAIILKDGLRVEHKQRLDLDTPYYASLKKAWGEQLERIFREALPKFEWENLGASRQNQNQQLF
ncbi:peptidase [Stenotrophobium rhamnosiphilum]|uniref:Peptidase n=1 Tax=Stenotrophobium rhamnosiphilum TaxID=2029166 RepID=A0A2T5MJ52_9GAMM|nr:peptidase [Stenotrophobium rhamnosiphilum]PTU32594.1 peptidase [Stenotrophobium rhamnosiphilum]